VQDKQAFLGSEARDAMRTAMMPAPVMPGAEAPPVGGMPRLPAQGGGPVQLRGMMGQ